eukprot:Skav212310  [mRNA]  locus=scaffold1913:181016:185199:- [translate_table: standard]
MLICCRGILRIAKITRAFRIVRLVRFIRASELGGTTVPSGPRWSLVVGQQQLLRAGRVKNPGPGNAWDSQLLWADLCWAQALCELCIGRTLRAMLWSAVLLALIIFLFGTEHLSVAEEQGELEIFLKLRAGAAVESVA